MKKVVATIACLIVVALIGVYFWTNLIPAELSLELAEDTSLALPLKEPLFGPDYTVLEQPVNGECVNDESGWTYTPKPDFHGTDTIVFAHEKAKDGTVKVAITVTPVPDAPRVELLSVTVDEGSRIMLAPEVVDPDGDTLTYRVTTPSSLGEIEARKAGSRWFVKYAALSPGQETIGFEVSDGTETVQGIIDVTVKPVPNPQVLLDTVKMNLPHESLTDPMFVGGEFTVRNRRLSIDDAKGRSLGKIIGLDSMQWFLATKKTVPGVDLSWEKPTVLTITEKDESGKAIVSRTRSVTWAELPFDETPKELTIRVGECVLIARSPNIGTKLRIHKGGSRPAVMATSPRSPLSWIANAPGTYRLERMEGDDSLGSVTIIAVGIEAPKALYCQTNKVIEAYKANVELRAKNLDPAAVFVEGRGVDVVTRVDRTEDRVMVQAQPNGAKEMVLCSRLGERGPVLWHCPFKTFELDTTGKKFVGVKGDTPTHMICGLKLMVRPVYPELTYQLKTRKVHHYPMNNSNEYKIPPKDFVWNEKTGWFEYSYDIYYNKKKRSTMHEANVFFNDVKVGGY